MFNEKGLMSSLAKSMAQFPFRMVILLRGAAVFVVSHERFEVVRATWW